MTTIFSVLAQFTTIAKASFAEALDDADVMADAAIMGIMATSKTEIDFWTKLYRVMYKTMAIVNMILFGIMVLKAIFGINLAFWAQWSVEVLLKRICDHLQVQGVRVIINSKKLANETLTLDEFLDEPNYEAMQARVDMVNKEAYQMFKEVEYELESEFEASGMQEQHVILKNGTEVTMKRNTSGGIDWKIDFSKEAWNIAARRVARAISINR